MRIRIRLGFGRNNYLHFHWIGIESGIAFFIKPWFRIDGALFSKYGCDYSG